jgi:hypothetical protein
MDLGEFNFGSGISRVFGTGGLDSECFEFRGLFRMKLLNGFGERRSIGGRFVIH